MNRVNIWSSPRNISTAFMYSFAQRADTSVVDEPLYAHYLKHTTTNAKHPGEAEILATMENNGRLVVENIIFGNYVTPNVIFKQMTHHLIGIDWDFLLQTKNVLLIRNPSEIIVSYSKVIPNPSIDDIGVKLQKNLFEYLVANNKLPAIVDAKDLLLNPKKILAQLCDYLEMPFDENMLSWKAGPRSEDGCWAKYWYANVHQSTGFAPYKEKSIAIPPTLYDLKKEAIPYYKTLWKYRLH